MKPERIPLREILEGGVSSALFTRVARRIETGALLLYPTETIYGLGGIATDEVREKIIRAKDRAPESPLIRLAGRRELFAGCNLVFTRSAATLAQRFWPGRVTLVMRVHGSGERMSIRVSDHPFMTVLAERVAQPLYSTSANMSGAGYRNDPDAIYDLFAGCVDLMIDDGPLPESPPSTVVDVSDDESVCVLREGVVSAAEIMEALKI